MNVWVLVTYYGSSGDTVAAYAKREDAEANALTYAREHRPRDLGEAPTTYAAALDGWEEHELWGSCDSRWELAEVAVE